MVRSLVSPWRDSKLQHMKSAYSKSWRWTSSSDPTFCSFFSASGFEGIILLPLNMDLQYHCTEHPRRHDTIYLMSAYFTHWNVVQGYTKARLLLNNYIKPLHIRKKHSCPLALKWNIWLHQYNVKISWYIHQNMSQHERKITAVKAATSARPAIVDQRLEISYENLIN